MDDKKTVALNIRTTPRIKALAEKLAKDDGRSVASYLERLIRQDAARKKIGTER